MSMSRRPRSAVEMLLLLASLSSAGCAPVALAQSTSSGCLAADQVRAPSRLTYLKELVSTSDSQYVASRQDLGLPVMAVSNVTLVTRKKDCQNAASALNTLRQEPGAVRHVWVYSLGNAGYAVDDPGLDVGFADKVLYFFGPKFTYKGTYSGF